MIPVESEERERFRDLARRQVPVAIGNHLADAESHPSIDPAQFHLGEAYRYIGRSEEAIDQYRKVLAIDPEHGNAASRLEQLGAGGGGGS